MLKKGDKIALVCNSNPRKETEREQIEQLVEKIEKIGLTAVYGRELYVALSGQERAKLLMDAYRDKEIKAIFDVSGGDLANGVLPYLDYEEIAQSSKIFWGYSDLTTLVNAIYAKTGRASVLYQIRNIVSDEHGEQQCEQFTHAILQAVDTPGAVMASNELFHVDYEMVQGDFLQGTVVGGNIRCLLKLAGTSYLPDLEGKVLLLEARSGLTAQVETYMTQLSQMGVFEKVSGVLLGTFTKLEAFSGMPRVEEILKPYIREELPVAVTRNIGHGTDSKAIWIGKAIGRK